MGSEISHAGFVIGSRIFAFSRPPLNLNISHPFQLRSRILNLTRLGEQIVKVELKFLNEQKIYVFDLVKGFLGQPEFRPDAPWKFAIPEFPSLTG